MAESPKLHATSGVPALKQLTEGMELVGKKLGLAEILYEQGLEKFNHFVNNRRGVIEEAHRKTEELASRLTEAESSEAEEIGESLATLNRGEQRAETENTLQKLSPLGRQYAQYKRWETEAQVRIANDLEKNVPITDYTSVKARIASGEAQLESMMTELPLPWQRIRALNDRIDRPEPKEKPPKRKFVHVQFITADGRWLEDEKAERDGDWVISHKHGCVAPYQDPTEMLEYTAGDKPAVPTGKRTIIYDTDPSPEWETELWRQGGFLDQMYMRHLQGRSPEQLRSTHRRRLIRKISWAALGVIVLVELVVWVSNNV